MSQISVNNLTFYYEGSFDNIFENVSFSIDTDWKLGFVGRNGKGKTTFLNLLLGKHEYSGSISTDTVFEGKVFWGIKDYDSYLSFKFGEYRELPPMEMRKAHPVSRLNV